MKSKTTDGKQRQVKVHRDVLKGTQEVKEKTDSNRKIQSMSFKLFLMCYPVFFF